MSNLCDEILLKNKKELKHSRRVFYVFVALALLTPFVACIDLFKPINETFPIWFQRSGATIVAFGVFAEVNAEKMANAIQLSSGFFSSTELVELEKQYSFEVKASKVGAIILIVFGTIVWGYGDLILKIFNK